MDSFENARRKAMAMERELETKLSSYQQLITSQSVSSLESGTVSSSDHNKATNALSNEIQTLLNSFTHIINQTLSSTATKPSQQLVLKRFREILFDSDHDFQKAEMSLQRRREAAELFDGAPGSGSGSGSGPSADNSMEMDALLRERSAINNSYKSSMDVLGQANGIRGELRNQRQSLMGSMGGVTNMVNNVPGVNSLIDAISRRKQRDNWVIGGAVAAGMFFMFWYLFG